jgi:hypothetical protein
MDSRTSENKLNATARDLQSRLIAPCFVQDGEQIRPDVPALFRRLLLFETYILQTIQFKEFVPLVHRIGIDNVVKLLNAGCLQLELDPTQIVNFGQFPDGPTYSRGKPPLPPLSFSFSILKAHDYSSYIQNCLDDVTRQLSPSVNRRKVTELESAIRQALLPLVDDSGLMASRGHDADLRSNSPALKKALSIELRQKKEVVVPESEIVFRATPIDETDFRTESNLSTFGLTKAEEHKVIERALIANGGVNSRIEDMRNHHALSGFIDGEFPLLSGRFDFLAETLSPGDHERTFSRVIDIRNLPSIDLIAPGTDFDVDRFLDIRRSKAAADFRTWIRTMKLASDEDIREQIGTIRSRLGPLVHGGIGKAVRIAISTVSGMVPLYGTPISLALSIVDSYLLEHIFPISGPTAFLSNEYQSLFEERPR